jgi:hypothetical protein
MVFMLFMVPYGVGASPPRDRVHHEGHEAHEGTGAQASNSFMVFVLFMVRYPLYATLRNPGRQAP